MQYGCTLHGKSDTDEAKGKNLTTEQKDMMFRLAGCMHVARNRKIEAKNACIPAGYTYLGQFIAHDMAFSLPLLNATNDAATVAATLDPDATRIDLSSLYGGGPDVSTHLYQMEKNGKAIRLALNPMAPSGLKNRHPKMRSESVSGPNMDMPRQQPSENASGKALAFGICADPRNDSHLLISQLTVMFSKFHNLIVDRVEQTHENDNVQTSREIFEISRNLVTQVFHKIVVKDYLERLLDRKTWQKIDKFVSHLEIADPITANYKPPVSIPPTAFNAAAFRVGHAMVRTHYELSSVRTGLGRKPDKGIEGRSLIAGIIGQTGKPDSLATIRKDWAIEWDRFFFSGDKPTGRNKQVRNFSYPIGPTIPSELGNTGRFFRTDDAPRGGVVYRDLLRGVAGELGCVDKFIDSCFWDLPLKLRLNAKARKKILETEFLGKFQTYPDYELSRDQLAELATHTPLFLYVLLEAMEQGGEHLGRVGSMIVGWTIAKSVVSVRINANQNSDWHAYFEDKPPKDMPGLIRFLRRQYKQQAKVG